MRKSKILLYHTLVFLLGSGAIALYFFVKLSALKGTAALALIVLIPVAGVFVAGFGILCLLSLVLFLLVSYMRH